MLRDNFFWGILMGLVVPILGIALVYTISFMPWNISVDDFFFLLKTNRHLVPKVISLGLLACIPLITWYRNRRCYTTLKGIFVVIILYGIVAIGFKFNWF